MKNRTVEGQNRYLLELSNALEESRRTSTCDSSPLSPPLGTFPETPQLSPSLSDGAYVSQRPVSFDGTQWAALAHVRRQSLLDMIETTTRPQSSPVLQLLTPPMTDSDVDTPTRIEDASVNGDHESGGLEVESTMPNSGDISVLNTRRKSRELCARPTLKRNESSLWSELCHSTATTPTTSVATDASSAREDNETNVTQTELRRQKREKEEQRLSRETTSYMVRLTSVEYPQLLFSGWAWVCFIALLAFAVGRVVRDGPKSMSAMTEERRMRVRETNSHEFG